jgi:hypothetical protein
VLELTDPLPEGLRHRDGRLLFDCRGCGKETEWPAEVEDFAEDAIKLCGGSPRCCP